MKSETALKAKQDLEVLQKEASTQAALLQEQVVQLQAERDNLESDLEAIGTELQAVSQSRTETSETIEVMKQKQAQLVSVLEQNFPLRRLGTIHAQKVGYVGVGKAGFAACVLVQFRKLSRGAF